MSGIGRLLGSLRSRFSVSDTVPITLKIFRTFPTGWKNLPQELVDEILIYLEDDFPSLVSCSRSCKVLFCSTRPLIHRTLCLSTGHQTDRDISSSRNRAQFDILRLAERAQVLQYTTRLIIRLGDDFVPENLRPHLQYFRIMRGITSLEIYQPNTARFLPAFDECFGHIVPTLRSLILVGLEGHVEDVFDFVPRFPLLRDLDLAPLLPISISPLPHAPPEITTPPPLNGTLRLPNIRLSVPLIQSLANIPGGIHFRSIETMGGAGTPLQAIIDACSSSVESIAFRTFLLGDPPDFRRCTVLKRLGIDVPSRPVSYSRLEEYLFGVLSTIASPSTPIFLVRFSGLRGLDPGQFRSSRVELGDLVKRGASTGMVFHVETIDLPIPLRPTSTRRSLRLEPYRLDAATDPRFPCEFPRGRS